MNGETPKKVTSAEGDCFLCKNKIPSLKEKVKIFGKSELEIGALNRSLGIDLPVYVCSENLVICRLCYNMLNAYDKVLKRVNQIVDGIKQKFENNGPLRIKRLSKDSTKPPEAKKSLSLDSKPSCEMNLKLVMASYRNNSPYSEDNTRIWYFFPEIFRPFLLLVKQRKNAMIKFIHSLYSLEEIV